MAEKWANTSGPPSSGVMNPKPFSALNHFTVPTAMIDCSLHKADLHPLFADAAELVTHCRRRTWRPGQYSPGAGKYRTAKLQRNNATTRTPGWGRCGA